MTAHELIGNKAPDFQTCAVTSEFKDVSLESFKGKWVILWFYPLNWTFVCPTEIHAFNDSLSAFESLNAVVLACSTESRHCHYAWRQRPRSEGGLGSDLKMPLLEDKNCRIAKAYGVYSETNGFPHRGLFIIDPSQTIRHVTINDAQVGRNVDEVLRVLKAFQFVEAHGEVCPANWVEGKKTMTGDWEGKKKYFEGEATVDGKKRVAGSQNGNQSKKAKA
eukprot:TRINITY_DN40932_c0_g1_i1.p1 TRINITY_DN40932_c0_g1~~TRINITY_DN40932_c0_g1_i1.p1  ORF type:complete len:220 (-),score=22.33 TRINITY_DN40932_c0_g1_i1:183-842(-)